MCLVPSRCKPADGQDAGVAAARVHPLRAGEQLGGPNATGRPGDWLLENGEVAFVIDGLGGGLHVHDDAHWRALCSEPRIKSCI